MILHQRQLLFKKSKMQVNTSNTIILLTILLLIPIGLSAQIGTRKYVTRGGDTTVIVNAGSTGLSGEDARFLLDDKASSEYLDRHSRYNKLKDAVDETGQVAKVVEVEKKETNPSSGSLGFRIAQKNIRYLQNEQKANRAAREIIHRDASIEELTYLKQKFGEKPSYFINGVQVDAKIAAGISDKDILSRSLKVSNTTTGNPNGEVWYVVNSKMFDRLGLYDYEMSEDDVERSYASQSGINSSIQAPAEEVNSIFEEEIATMPSSITDRDYSRLTPEQQQKLSTQQREIEELKRQIEEVRQQRAAISGAVYQEAYPTQQQAPSTVRAITPRRTQSVEEVISFRDSPQERTRRERDQIMNSQSTTDPEITEDTPRRSVRRIKDRERNR